MQFSKAIDDFKQWRSLRVKDVTVARYDGALRSFCLALDDPEVEQITSEQVVHYLLTMQRLGWKRNGVNITALAFRKFFEYLNLRNMRVIDEQLIPLPRKEFNIPRVATKESYEKLIAQIPAKTKHPNHIRNRALIALLWDSGMRVGEALSLDIDQVDIKARSATIRTEKSRGRRPIREVFWSEPTNKMLVAWIEKRRHLNDLMAFHDPTALFVTITKNPQMKIRGRRMTPRSAAEVFRMLSNQAGIPVVNAHSLRHAFGRDLIKEGASSADVSNLLGHSSLESSHFYTMMWGTDLRERYTQFMGANRGKMRKALGAMFQPVRV